jgi:putative heme-binding domain-containing protein
LNVDGAAAKIMPLVERSATNGIELHYALTLRYLNAGWSFDLKRRLMTWYEGTRSWEGGASLTGYVSNIVGATTEKFTPEERNYFVRHWRQHPAGAALIVRVSQPDQISNFEKIIADLLEEAGRQALPGEEDLITAAMASLGKSTSPSARASLRHLFEQYPDRRDTIARAIAANPTAEDWPVLIRTLQFASPTTMQECLGALRDLNRKPQNADEYRAVIQAALQLKRRGGKAALGLLQQWTGVDDNSGRKVEQGIAFFQKWYRDKFPTAPLPELPKDDATKSKYTFQQIAALLDQGDHGNATRGRLVFTKAKCVKCHRFQGEGEAVGPDLTSVRRRFQRKEIVESIVYPSQVISDQYRMVQVETKEGQVYVGMPIPGVSKNNKKLVLLLSDTTRLEIPKSRIEEQTTSKISVMPTGLLDPLSLQEVADLLAFLETSKFNAPVAEAAKK